MRVVRNTLIKESDDVKVKEINKVCPMCGKDQEECTCAEEQQDEEEDKECCEDGTCECGDEEECNESVSPFGSRKSIIKQILSESFDF